MPLCPGCRAARRIATAERRKIATAEWRRQNPEHDVIKARRRRARKLGLPFEPYTLAEIAARDHEHCCLCGDPVDMTLSGLETWGPTIDHVTPISNGGPDTRRNVQLAHRRCNLIKGNSMPDVVP